MKHYRFCCLAGDWASGGYQAHPTIVLFLRGQGKGHGSCRWLRWFRSRGQARGTKTKAPPKKKRDDLRAVSQRGNSFIDPYIYVFLKLLYLFLRVFAWRFLKKSKGRTGRYWTRKGLQTSCSLLFAFASCLYFMFLCFAFLPILTFLLEKLTLVRLCPPLFVNCS